MPSVGTGPGRALPTRPTSVVFRTLATGRDRADGDFVVVVVVVVVVGVVVVVATGLPA